MSSENKFGMLRRILRAIGLSEQAANDAVDFILDLLGGEGKEERSAEFPYQLRDNFLSPAELSFFEVLRTVVGNRAVICPKVNLGDVFWVKQNDPSKFRIYTNKIDRKHIDFLLCQPATMYALVGIELDDRSHQRQDRQERDVFVNGVFKAAGLPLLHVPAKRGYIVTELAVLLAPHLGTPSEASKPTPISAKQPVSAAPAPQANQSPRCPKCGGEMVLRTAKTGANAGNRFWGCSNYPNCRSMLPY